MLKKKNKPIKKEFLKKILYRLEINYPYLTPVCNLQSACGVENLAYNNVDKLSVNSIITDLIKDSLVLVEPEATFKELNSKNTPLTEEDSLTFSGLGCKLKTTGFELLHSYMSLSASKNLEYLTSTLIIFTAILAMVSLPVMYISLVKMSWHLQLIFVIIFIVLGLSLVCALRNLNSHYKPL